MSTLLQKELKVNRIVTTNVGQARAFDDPARMKILQILYRKQLSTEQIVEELRKEGYKKATTTIRHHLDVLKHAGLVEIVKIQEVRGAVMKYYGTSVKILGFTLPSNFDSEYSKTITDASLKMEKIIKNIAQKNTSKIRKKYSENQYGEYVLMEIVNRAVTNVFENQKFILDFVPSKKLKDVSANN